MADKKISQLTAASTPLAGTEVLPIVQGGSTVKVSVDNLTAGKAVSASALTLTGGIANAVAYLNASKAVTTGGVLLFDGSNLGVGSTPTHKVDIVSPAGAQNILRAGQSGVSNGFVISSDGTNLSYQFDTGNLVQGTAAKGVNFSANTGAAGKTSSLLNWYEEGTWTPTDASGASLTFTSATGRYTRVGNVVFLFGFVQYPVTASGANASIGGLPFTVNSNSSALQGAVTYSQVATVRSIGVNPSTTNTTVYTFAGAAVTNATLSGTVLYFNSTYFV